MKTNEEMYKEMMYYGHQTKSLKSEKEQLKELKAKIKKNK